MSGLPEQTPMVWPSVGPLNLRTVATSQLGAAQGFPTVADGDALAIARGDLARIADGEPDWTMAPTRTRR